MEPQGDERPVTGPHAHGAVNPPVVRSSTFTFPTAEEGARRMAEGDGLVYTRLDNPTTAALEAEIARLEGAEGAVATASGMGAIHVALMSLLSPRARVVVDPCVYGCTYSLLQKLAKWGIELVPVETTDTEAVAEALEPGADLVFLETPMNPTLRVVDLEATADLAHEAGARLVVDNTFATPIAQRPLELGADLVVHSLTKAIAGHSDLLGGAVAGSQELLEDVRLWRKDAGPVLDPETAWLALRGAQTLELRVRQMTRSAGHIARHLEGLGHEVRHPLLASHPDHTVAKRQMPLGTSVFTLDLGSAKAAMTFLDRLEHVSSAVSLGGVESLACHPASTTHAPLGEAGQAAAAISEGLVRVSVGIEPTEVLIEDIEQALSGLAKPQAARIQA